MSDIIKKFNNDLICVKLYETRMHDRLDLLRKIFLNGLQRPAFDVPTWLTQNKFIHLTRSDDDSVLWPNERGIKYLNILETAEGDRQSSMYFNTTLEEKNKNDAMHGHPLFSECSLYEDVTHSSPNAKLGEYLNPPRFNKETKEWGPPAPFDGTWVSYDGKEYTRK
jgi:hypothetical protein